MFTIVKCKLFEINLYLFSFRCFDYICTVCVQGILQYEKYRDLSTIFKKHLTKFVSSKTMLTSRRALDLYTVTIFAKGDERFCLNHLNGTGCPPNFQALNCACKVNTKKWSGVTLCSTSKWARVNIHKISNYWQLLTKSLNSWNSWDLGEQQPKSDQLKLEA